MTGLYGSGYADLEGWCRLYDIEMFTLAMNFNSIHAMTQA